MKAKRTHNKLKILLLMLGTTLLPGCSYTPWWDALQAGILGSFQNGAGGVFTNIFFGNV